jgi:hypothetical protein
MPKWQLTPNEQTVCDLTEDLVSRLSALHQTPLQVVFGRAIGESHQEFYCQILGNDPEITRSVKSVVDWSLYGLKGYQPKDASGSIRLFENYVNDIAADAKRLKEETIPKTYANEERMKRQIQAQLAAQPDRRQLHQEEEDKKDAAAPAAPAAALAPAAADIGVVQHYINQFTQNVPGILIAERVPNVTAGRPDVVRVRQTNDNTDVLNAFSKVLYPAVQMRGQNQPRPLNKEVLYLDINDTGKLNVERQKGTILNPFQGVAAAVPAPAFAPAAPALMGHATQQRIRQATGLLNNAKVKNVEWQGRKSIRVTYNNANDRDSLREILNGLGANIPDAKPFKNTYSLYIEEPADRVALNQNAPAFIRAAENKANGIAQGLAI